MIKGTTKKAKENARKLVDSMIDLSGYNDIQTMDKHAAIRDICAQEIGRKWSLEAFKDWCWVYHPRLIQRSSFTMGRLGIGYPKYTKQTTRSVTLWLNVRGIE